ncbi:MAG: hypothetical protein WA001_05215 [Patescibacteria group bacterium]
MPLTSFLAQLIGLLLLASGAFMLFQSKVFIKILNDMTENRTTLFMVGVAVFMGGASIVLTHNVWNAGLLPLVVTLMGWIWVLHGLACIFAPNHGITRLFRAFNVEKYCWAYGILYFAIGACLTYAGFMR